MIDPEGRYRTIRGQATLSTPTILSSPSLSSTPCAIGSGEMHVDGFRFDLASCLTRDHNGMPLPNPPVIEAMTQRPDPGRCEIDRRGLGCRRSVSGRTVFPAKGDGVNGMENTAMSYADSSKGQMAARESSQPFYRARKISTPATGVPTTASTSSQLMMDLLCATSSVYQSKHNLENGENNRDGNNQNDSWNCGEEGPTSDSKIQLLRERQMRNFHTALMVALGTPMLLMGDEYGHTRNGNNNAYCQDNELNWFLWDQLDKNKSFARFHRLMIQFRIKNPLLKRKEFLREEEVSWHGHAPHQPDWREECRFVAYTLNDAVHSESLYKQYVMFMWCTFVGCVLFGVRLYTQDVAGGKPKAISPEGVDAVSFAISPDGQFVVGIGPDQKGYLFSTTGGDPRPVNGLEAGDIPINWGPGWAVNLSLSERRDAGEGVWAGVSDGEENSVEADRAAGSDGRVDDWAHSDDAGWEDLYLWISSDAGRSVFGGGIDIRFVFGSSLDEIVDIIAIYAD